MLTPFDRWAADYCVNGSAVWLMVAAGLLGWLVSRWCWHWDDCLVWNVSPWKGPVCPYCGARQARSWGDWFRSPIFGRTCAACGKWTSQRLGGSVVVALLFAG